MKKDLEQAVQVDLGRCREFTELSEIYACIDICDYYINNLDDLSSDTPVDPPIIFSPCTTYVRKEPLGVALIMGSWNFPYFVTLKPLACAIAAGNCAIVKPSELGPTSAELIQSLVKKYLDNRCFRVMLGGAETCIELTKSKFDVICFTGSTEKGRLVAKAAGENLVPCILELGGKCPFIVDSTADLDFAAHKIIFGKFQNAGQICIGVDYVLVRENLVAKLIKLLLKHAKQQYGLDPKDPASLTNFNPNVGKVLNE